MMKTISLLATAVLAIALYGCSSEAPETSQDKPKSVKSEHPKAKSNVSELESTISDHKSKIYDSVQKTQPRNSAVVKSAVTKRTVDENTATERTVNKTAGTARAKFESTFGKGSDDEMDALERAFDEGVAYKDAVGENADVESTAEGVSE